jgi:Zn-dependent peptidase ImmA (M78 family)
MTVTELSLKLKITKQAVYYRLERLNLKSSNYAQDYPYDVYKLIDYNNSRLNTNRKIDIQKTIKIIELYLHDQNISIETLSISLKCSKSFVSITINNYFNNNNFLIIGSKMND